MNSAIFNPGRSFTDQETKYKSITSGAGYKLLGGDDKTKSHAISIDNYNLADAILNYKDDGDAVYIGYGSLRTLAGSVGLNIAAFLVNGNFEKTVQTNRFEFSEAE